MTITKDIIFSAETKTIIKEIDLIVNNETKIDEDTSVKVVEICNNFAIIDIDCMLVNKSFSQYVFKDMEVSFTPALLGEYKQYVLTLS